MSNYKLDILVGLLFITGIWGFISGEFIISSALFCSAAILGTFPKKQYE
jgi:hypothetical protein